MDLPWRRVSSVARLGVLSALPKKLSARIAPFLAMRSMFGAGAGFDTAAPWLPPNQPMRNYALSQQLSSYAATRSGN